MRIGMFADMYKPYLSGVTNHISLYKNRLEELGHEVFVFTFGNRDYADDERNVIRSPGMPLAGTGAQFGLLFSAEAREAIRELDIAHVHHPFLSGRLVLRAARPLGIPIVFTNHSRYDLYSDEYAGYLPESVRYAYLRRYLDRFCRSCNLVIAPSPGIERWLEEFGIGGPITTLPNAVDTQRFTAPSNPRTKADFGFPDDAFVLLYLGRVSHEKNISVLMDAFARAALHSPRLRLLVVGDGTAMDEARARLGASGVAERAVFAGSMLYEDVPDVCAVGDAFVTASVSEVHPLVIMEAMAAGMPAVGIESPGVSDIIEDGETGMLVPSSALDPAGELAERLVRLAEDEALRRRLAQRAVDVATTRYDIRTATEKLVALYSQLIAEDGRGVS